MQVPKRDRWDNPATLPGRQQGPYPYEYKFLAKVGSSVVGFEMAGFTHTHAEKRLRAVLGNSADVTFLRHGTFPGVQNIGHGAHLSRRAA